MSASSTTSSTRYSPVYKAPENHVDELKTRFQAMNQNIRISFLGDPQPQGLQPSAGSDTERESDASARIARSAGSSASGAHSDNSSTLSSPKRKRDHPKRDKVKWHVEQHETDF